MLGYHQHHHFKPIKKAPHPPDESGWAPLTHKNLLWWIQLLEGWCWPFHQLDEGSFLNKSLLTEKIKVILPLAERI